MRATILLLLLAGLTACAQNDQKPAGGATKQSAAPAMRDVRIQAGLSFRAPKDWSEEPPANSMRQLEFVLPKGKPDAEEARLVVFYFGPNGAGGVQANLDRWYTQIQPDDGRTGAEAATTTTHTVNGMKVTTVDLVGRFVAETAPGSGTRVDHPDYRMRAAIVETARGPFFLKLVGPKCSVDPQDAGWSALVESFSSDAG